MEHSFNTEIRAGTGINGGKAPSGCSGSIEVCDLLAEYFG
jgi:hypothetical protein